MRSFFTILVLMVPIVYSARLHPLLEPSKAWNGLSEQFGHLLRFRSNVNQPCTGRGGATGTCMFTFDCIRKKGVSVGVCLSGIYVRSCCKLANTSNIINEFAPLSTSPVVVTTTVPTSTTASTVHSSVTSASLVIVTRASLATEPTTSSKASTANTLNTQSDTLKEISSTTKAVTTIATKIPSLSTSTISSSPSSEASSAAWLLSTALVSSNPSTVSSTTQTSTSPITTSTALTNAPSSLALLSTINSVPITTNTTAAETIASTPSVTLPSIATNATEVTGNIKSTITHAVNTIPDSNISTEINEVESESLTTNAAIIPVQETSSTSTIKNIPLSSTLSSASLISEQTIESSTSTTKLPSTRLPSTKLPSTSASTMANLLASTMKLVDILQPLTITSRPQTTSRIPITHPTFDTTKDEPSTTKMTTPKISTTTAKLSTLNLDANTTTNSPNVEQMCGKRLSIPKGRIVGGTKSYFGEWPWMVSLRQWKKNAFLHKCGAALLNEYWAVTAAHCVESVASTDLLLRLGEYDVSNEKEPFGYIERRVQIIASHPQFDAKTFENDLALLRFYEKVPLRNNIMPVCIPEGNSSFVSSWATVTGWGRLYEDGPLPDVIQHVKVPIITNKECEVMYRHAGYIEHIPNIFICAGLAKGGRDSCEGDSGGPLVIEVDGRWSLIGIISWGIGCALPNQPGVYTRITEFAPWINKIVKY